MYLTYFRLGAGSSEKSNTGSERAGALTLYLTYGDLWFLLSLFSRPSTTAHQVSMEFSQVNGIGCYASVSAG